MTASLSRILKIVLIACILIIYANYAQAGHVFGAEISYKFAGGGKYTVTAIVYRDCNGITVSGNDVRFSTTQGCLSGYVSLNTASCCTEDVTPRAKSSCDICSSSTCSYGFGIQKHTVTGTVDLSQYSCCIYEFSVQECCDANGNNVYAVCMLNRCHGDKSGPSFETDPISVVCENECQDRYQYALPGQPEDSVYHLLTDPLSGSGSPVSFPSPYSTKTPVSYTGTDPDAAFKPPLCAGFHYDHQTGSLQFRPTKTDVSYFAFKAEEYSLDSNGKYYLSGTTMRSTCIYVTNCGTNHTPIFSAVNGNNTADTITVCSNVPLKIFIKASDIDPKDYVTLTANGPAGMKIINHADYWPTDTFIWTPSNKDVRSKPYMISLKAVDSKTPLPGMSEKKIFILVKDSMPDTKIAHADNGCGRFHFSVTKPVDKNYGITYQWLENGKEISDLASADLKTTVAGRHVISLILTRKGGCNNTLTDTVWFDTAYHKLPAYTGICKGASFQLSATSKSSVTWTPSGSLSDSTVYNPVATPARTTVYTVTGTDKDGCIFTDTAMVQVTDMKLKTPHIMQICTKSIDTIKLSTATGASYSWKNIDSLISYTYLDSMRIVNYLAEDTWFPYTVKKNGCAIKDSVLLQLPKSINLGATLKKCEGDTLHLHVDGGTKYTWKDAVHLTTLSTSPDLVVPGLRYVASGQQYSLDMADSVSGCLRHGDLTVKIVPFRPVLANAKVAACPGGKFTNAVSGSGNSFRWYQGSNTLSAASNLSITASKSSVYKVLIKDTVNHCSVTDSFPVYVSPAAMRYADKQICNGSQARLSTHGGSSYLWKPSAGLGDSTSAEITVSPSKTTAYTVAVKDSASGCLRIDTSVVIIAQDCVWPGDANRDQVADYLDVLQIGLGYGSKGPARGKADTAWQAYPVTDWNQAKAGIDEKFFDANGDGDINAADTAVISAHYGLTHKKWTAGTGNPNDPPVYFKFTKDTFYSGETATAYLYAGTAQHKLQGAYGIGVQASYAGSPVVAASGSMQPFCEYFCTGNELNFVRTFQSSQQFDASFTETAGIAGSGAAGRIGLVSFILADSNAHSYNSQGEWIYARLVAATALDKNGKEISVFGKDDSALVLKKKKTGIENSGYGSGNNFIMYPDPANDFLIISAKENIDEVTIYNAMGQILRETHARQPQLRISTATLPSGIYFIELKTEKGTGLKKFVISR